MLASTHHRTWSPAGICWTLVFPPQGPKGGPHPGHTDPGMMTEETDLSPQDSSPLIMGQVVRTVQEFTGYGQEEWTVPDLQMELRVGTAKASM